MTDSLGISYDVFISYSSQDVEWVETLARNLEGQGYRVFFDRWVVAAGAHVVDILDRALGQCEKGVLVITPESQSSGWVRTEYRRMMARRQQDPGFVFVPIILAGQAELAFLDDIVQIDFREPAAYRSAFHRLVCGLKGQGPGKGPLPDFAPDLEIPEPTSDGGVGICGTAAGVSAFVESLFEVFYRNPAVALLAQAGRHHGALDQAILSRAEDTWGEERVRRICLPYSSNADTGELFRFIAGQCGLEEEVTSGLGFQTALGKELSMGPLFLMVTGIENASAKGRKDIAGVLRALGHQHRKTLKLVICGGEKLADLKYAGGELSLLNDAEELRCPELTAFDLISMAAHMGMTEPLEGEDARMILSITGGHPGLVVESLRIKQQMTYLLPKELSEELVLSSALWHLFTPYARDPETSRAVCACLKKPDLGPYRPFLQDRTLSDLYWKNLLVKRGRRLVWRSELVREGGYAILGGGA